MGYELLEALVELLNAAGIRAGEEYPAGERVEIAGPVAAVGLRELDSGEGVVRFSVRILSPRNLGGWCCQTHSAKAGQVLCNAGYSCETEEMEYLGGSDCFCISMTASRTAAAAETLWKVFCGEVLQEQVVSFRAIRNQGRRIVGAFCQSEPIGVTPGSGGWEIELIQTAAPEPEEPAEPFVMTVHQGGVVYSYGGCCWNETELFHSSAGLKRIRRGFALSREVRTDG